MKVFVLDNSLRESTVGQSIGHSFQDKFEVLNAAAKCGFNHRIVGAFGVSRRVDDAFASRLQEMIHIEKQPFSHYAFSEVCSSGAMTTLPYLQMGRSVVIILSIFVISQWRC